MEAALTRTIEYLWTQSWQIALLAVAVGVLAVGLRNRSAHLRYLLWLVVLAKCIVPPVHTVHLAVLPPEAAAVPVFSEPPWRPLALTRDGAARPMQRESAEARTEAVVPAREPAIAEPRNTFHLSTAAWLAMLWATGVCVFAVVVAVKALGTGSWLRRGRQALPNSLIAEIETDLASLGIRHPPRMWLMGGVGQPFVWGLVRGDIYLPLSFASVDSRDHRRSILGHELCHVLRFDSAVNALQMIVQAAFWFHPFVWGANKRIRAEREKCCDEMAIAYLRAPVKDYSTAIVNVLIAEHESTRPVPSLAVAGPVKNVEERIKTMLRPGKKFYTHPSVVAGVIVLSIALATVPTALVLTTQAATSTASAPQPEGKAGLAANKDASITPQATGAGATEKAPPAGASDTIIDPNTGLNFKPAIFITGNNDIIKSNNGLSLSPNGKFLLQVGRVVPLDGSPPFKLDGLRGAEDAAWSPDGRMIAFRLQGQGVWVLPVSPDTGQATGPARRLADDNAGWTLRGIQWSGDAGQIYLAFDDGVRLQPRCLSVQDGTPAPSRDAPRFGLRSPDGRRVAFSRYFHASGVWVVDSADAAPKLVATVKEGTVPLWWSPDGQWLLCGPSPCSHSSLGFRFVRMTDHYAFDVATPPAVGNDGLGLSPDHKKMWFYRGAYEVTVVAEAASLRGGGFKELALPKGIMPIWPAWWASDGRHAAFLGVDTNGSQGIGIWLAPLPGGDAVRLDVKANTDGDFGPFAIAPDGKRLFGVVEREEKPGPSIEEYYVIPISIERAQTTGQPVSIFKNAPGALALGDDARPMDLWSPDSTRLIVPVKAGKGNDLWVVHADGSPARRITETPDDIKLFWAWSPDSKRISYCTRSRDSATLYTVPADGGASRPVWTQQGSSGIAYCWSPDGSEIHVVSNKVVMAVSLADGATREILSVAEVGLDWLEWLEWSPDGKTLLLTGDKYGELPEVALYRPLEKRVTRLPGEPAGQVVCVWSADGQWISCVAVRFERVRPAGMIHELDIEAALQRAVASAPQGAVEPPPPEQGVQAPPLVNGQYTDHFDGPLAPYWRFVDPRWEGPTHVHEVQNGQLVLENSQAIIGLPDWTDYSLKVRICVQSLGAQEAVKGVSFRRNTAGAYLLHTEIGSRDLWLGVDHTGPAKQRHLAAIDSVPHDFALNTWYTIEVEVKGSHIKASVDGTTIMEEDDATHPQGAVGLLAGRARVRFDDFSIRQLP